MDPRAIKKPVKPCDRATLKTARTDRRNYGDYTCNDLVTEDPRGYEQVNSPFPPKINLELWTWDQGNATWVLYTSGISSIDRGMPVIDGDILVVLHDLLFDQVL